MARRIESRVDLIPTIIMTTQGALNINGAKLDITPGVNGKGAVIQGSSASSLAVIGIIEASGDGTADGGTITLTASGAIDLTNANLNAKGGTNGGKGGQIVITTDTDTLTVKNTLNVNGGGSGAGGTVNLNALNVSVDSATVSANGGNSGKGGQVTIGQTSSSLMALSNSSISADSGASVASGSTTQKVGIASLNSAVQFTQVTLSAASPQTGGQINVNSGGGDITLDLHSSITGGSALLSVYGTLTNNGQITTTKTDTATGLIGVSGLKTTIALSGTGSYKSAGAAIGFVVSGLTELQILGQQTFTLTPQESGGSPLAMAANLISLSSADSLLAVPDGSSGTVSIVMNASNIDNEGLIAANSVGLSADSVRVVGDGSITATVLSAVVSNPSAISPTVRLHQGHLNGIVGLAAGRMTLAIDSISVIDVEVEDGNFQLGNISTSASSGTISIVKTNGVLLTASGNSSSATSIQGASSVLLESVAGTIDISRYTNIIGVGSVTLSVGTPALISGSANPNIDVSQANGTTYWGSAGVNAAACTSSAIVSAAGKNVIFSEPSTSPSPITLEEHDLIQAN